MPKEKRLNTFNYRKKGLNINIVKEKIYEKIEWYKNNYKEDYIRQFGNENTDIFEYYNELQNKN